MPLKTINGSPYYYRERRREGGIAWEYVGAGASALAAYSIDATLSARRRGIERLIAAERREAELRRRSERDACRERFREMRSAANVLAKSLDEGLRLARAAFVLAMRAKGFTTHNRSLFRRVRSTPSVLQSQLDLAACEVAVELACRLAPDPLPPDSIAEGTDAIPAGAIPSPLRRVLAFIAAVNARETLACEARAASEDFAMKVAATCRDPIAERHHDRCRGLHAAFANRARIRAKAAARMLTKLDLGR